MAVAVELCGSRALSGGLAATARKQTQMPFRAAEQGVWCILAICGEKCIKTVQNAEAAKRARCLKTAATLLQPPAACGPMLFMGGAAGFEKSFRYP